MEDQIEITTGMNTDKQDTAARPAWLGKAVVVLLLISVLLVGAYFRLSGLDWDDDLHLHPDERFMTMVASSISSPQGQGEYFDTSRSSLNPHNVGYGFYVYGTLPLFMVRHVAELISQTGYSQIHLVGRVLSTVADLVSVLFVFLIALRLFRSTRLALLGALAYAAAVLPIQLSHFFTVDTFANCFTMMGIYFAVRVATREDVATNQPTDGYRYLYRNWRGIGDYLLFGLALGLALASKVSTAPLALMVVLAAWLAWKRNHQEDEPATGWLVLRNLALAALTALLVFRIFQPYAFSGPGFFGVAPNPKWIANLQDLSNQSGGDNDFPPALQWARRPITFAFENMVRWGLGLPLGIAAWAAFLWMGWTYLRDWLKSRREGSIWVIPPSVLIWVWTLVYFAWQSSIFSRAMRYQLPVYPTLAIMAGWGIYKLWQHSREVARRRLAWQMVAVLTGLVVLGSSVGWAYAFSRIYTRPATRLAASEWVYQNVPAAFNLQVETPEGTVNQPAAFRQGYTLTASTPWVVGFIPGETGTLQSLSLAQVKKTLPQGGVITLMASVSLPDGSVLTTGMLVNEFISESDNQGATYEVAFAQPFQLTGGQAYIFTLQVLEDTASLEIMGAAGLKMTAADGGVLSVALPDPVYAVRPGQPFAGTFNAVVDGTVDEVFVPHLVAWNPGQEPLTATLTISGMVNGESVQSSAEVRDGFHAQDDPRGEAYTFRLEPPLKIEKGQTYSVALSVGGETGTLAAYGSSQAKESSWDDAIPYGLGSYSPFDYWTGLYRSEHNLEMYWDDNEVKRERFVDILNRSDYIFITSNRQWGTTPRVPERYPLATAFYRMLIGCPAADDILDCYREAQPGMYTGELGFELVSVFTSEPAIGPWEINTQYAEEPFTVYDHPKVLIFKKSDDYDPAQVRAELGEVDLTKVVHLLPGQADQYTGDLMLPADRLAEQRSGGTWADIFNTDALYNRYPALALVIWYLVITLIGWVMYPTVRMGFRGLPDRGYPVSRLVGLLVFAWLVWLAGSARIPFSKVTISMVFLVLVVFNGVLFALQREEIMQELRERKRYFMMVELISLVFFTFFLLIRLGNPDLWHPAKGGEKPMDMSYLNAVIKSTSFPPYDPWFAGGYLNYYYYGFVLVAVPIKWLGIVPSIAYNLFLPTFFSFGALGAFCVGWNLITATRSRGGQLEEENRWLGLPAWPLIGGLISSLAMMVIGNLGTVRMLWHGLIKLVAAEPVESIGFFERIPYTFQGLIKLLGGAGMPYGSGDWYWIPSRTIPGEPITEFPFFTFLYADPHAHLFALPLTVAAVAFALSVLLGRWQWGDGQGRNRWLHFGVAVALGAVITGALRPANITDQYTYLVLAAVVVFYTAFRYYKVGEGENRVLPRWMEALFIGLGAAALLVLLSQLFYQPFNTWYYQKFGVEYWKGDRTPVGSYFTHWGLFLVTLGSWLIWEAIEWMDATPLSRLRKLAPYKAAIQSMVLVLLVALVGLILIGAPIALMALPLLALAGVLILRPDLPETKRLVAFMVGTGLLLTIVVELFAVKNDIGRMNIVFKLYMHAWTLLSLSSAAGLMWLIPAVARRWTPVWRNAWQVVMTVLVFSALLFPITAGTDKVTDRMTRKSPHSLDGMTYMAYSTYSQSGKDMQLAEDYYAIRWMQENVQGSPVIVEANTPEYRWGSRFTINTGLPGVVGWNYHQRQQRGIISNEQVTSRVDQIGAFYNTISRDEALDFLQKYDVSYIVVGQLEQAEYSPAGISKFTAWNGDLWDEVYRQGQTAIYRVRK